MKSFTICWARSERFVPSVCSGLRGMTGANILQLENYIPLCLFLRKIIFFSLNINLIFSPFSLTVSGSLSVFISFSDLEMDRIMILLDIFLEFYKTGLSQIFSCAVTGLGPDIRLFY